MEVDVNGNAIIIDSSRVLLTTKTSPVAILDRRDRSRRASITVRIERMMCMLSERSEQHS
jgi:hypothetical protein